MAEKNKVEIAKKKLKIKREFERVTTDDDIEMALEIILVLQKRSSENELCVEQAHKALELADELLPVLTKV